MKTVGIIGGLGPETTSEFYLDLMFSCCKQNKTCKPGILIASVPLPYQIEEELILFGRGVERYLPLLISEAKRLEKAGADFLVMPCNSLHIFIEEIRSAVAVPVLSVIEETVRFFKRERFTKVGVISTSVTLQNKLYETALKKCGIGYETPNELQQAKLGKCILNLVAGRHNNKDREELLTIINSFEKKNVDCVALACTDLQLLIPNHPTLKIIDTMKLFADSAVKKVLR